MSNEQKKFDVSFSMLTEQEYGLVVNAIKRQVDYFRTKVFNHENALSDYALTQYKINYKFYNDLYKKIITDYNNVVKCNV